MPDGLFDNGPDGFTGDAVKDVSEALLAHLGDGFDFFTRYRDIDQGGCGGKIVIPNAVVNGLEMPQTFACFNVDGHKTFSKESVAFARTSPIIAVGSGERKVDMTEVVIAAHHGPYVDVAGVAVGMFFPGIGSELAILRDGVEDPFQFAGADVKSLHVTGCPFFGGRAV